MGFTNRTYESIPVLPMNFTLFLSKLQNSEGQTAVSVIRKIENIAIESTGLPSSLGNYRKCERLQVKNISLVLFSLRM